MNCYYILSYVTGYLRLGCIANSCYRVHEAYNWFQEALGVKHQNTRAWQMLEYIYTTRLQWRDENYILRVRGVHF